jgi:hypothetical protein
VVAGVEAPLASVGNSPVAASQRPVGLHRQGTLVERVAATSSPSPRIVDRHAVTQQLLRRENGKSVVFQQVGDGEPGLLARDVVGESIPLRALRHRPRRKGTWTLVSGGV